ALVDGMAVSIEDVDSRWRQARESGALLKLADRQSHGALALGDWRPFAPRDWSQLTCAVQNGASSSQSFRGTHSLCEHALPLPTRLRHATRGGQSVPRGTVVTTGTWCALLEARRGERVRAVFEGIGEAEARL